MAVHSGVAHQFFTVSGRFLAPVLLEPATYLFLAGSLLTAGVVLERVAFSFLSSSLSVMSVLHDTLLSTWQRERERESSFKSTVWPSEYEGEWGGVCIYRGGGCFHALHLTAVLGQIKRRQHLACSGLLHTEENNIEKAILEVILPVERGPLRCHSLAGGAGRWRAGSPSAAQCRACSGPDLEDRQSPSAVGSCLHHNTTRGTEIHLPKRGTGVYTCW